MRGPANPNQRSKADAISKLKVHAQRLRELWEQAPDLEEQALLVKYREKYRESLSMAQLRKVIRKVQKKANRIGTTLDAHFELVRTLILEHPGMNTVQLTGEYNRRHQGALSVGQMVHIVQAVDPARWKRLAEDERVSRPRRLKEILDAYPEILYGELCAEYQNRYGVKLVQAQASQALIKIGIRRQNPKRGKEAEEFSQRPKRLKVLHQRQPHWTNDQLADEYQRRYRIKLANRQISDALLRAGIRRRRGRDTDELAQRPKRLKALYKQHADWTDDQLSIEYEQIYHITLKHAQVSAALLQAGIRRNRVVDADELAQRPKRLKAVQRRHANLTYNQLGVEYERLYGIKLDNSEVSSALQRLGIRRNRTADAKEFSKRPGRVKALFKRHQDWTGDQLAAEYARRYHINLDPGQISQALLLAGVRRQEPQRPRDAEEFSKRARRLTELLKQHPDWLYEQLADAYEHMYHVRLALTTISTTFAKVNIHRRTIRPVDAKELAKRPERLWKLAQKYPRVSRTQLAAKYERLYQIKLSPSAVSAALRKNSYQS